MSTATIIAARRLAEEARGVARQEAILWNLPDEHFSQIAEWKLAGLPQAKIAELCAADLGLPPAKIAGRTAFSEWWAEFWPWYCVARRRANVQGAESLDAEITRQPFKVEAVLRDEIKQRAFELLQQEEPPEKLVKAFLSAVLKMRDQDQKEKDLSLAERRVKLLEEKQAKAVETLGDSKLSDAEKATRLREIFQR